MPQNQTPKNPNQHVTTAKNQATILRNPVTSKNKMTKLQATKRGLEKNDKLNNSGQ